jgi:hypothetical protein
VTNTIRYSQAQRAEHNVIAAAILAYDVVNEAEDFEPMVSSFQAAGDAMTQKLIETYNASIRELREAKKVLIHGKDFKLARLHALEAERHEAQHRHISRLIEADRKESQGRFKDGVIYRVKLEDSEVGSIEMFFDLVLAWKNERLILLNQDEIERMSHEGRQDLHGCFKDLCAWILDHERRGEFGRPKNSNNEPIWRQNSGSLTLRPMVAERYPLLPRALEALRRTLRTQCFPMRTCFEISR